MKGAKHQPTDQTRRQVELLAALNIPQDHIATIIGCSDVTLRKHYRDELNIGLSKVAAQVGTSLVKKALSERADAVPAAKFFLTARAGWTEKQEHSVAMTLDGAKDRVAQIVARLPKPG